MDQRIKLIADHYGLFEESAKCLEELNELQNALAKNDEENIEEEIADVLITVCEQIYLRGCGDKVKYFIVDEKLARQIKRMEEEEK